MQIKITWSYSEGPDLINDNNGKNNDFFDFLLCFNRDFIYKITYNSYNTPQR